MSQAPSSPHGSNEIFAFNYDDAWQKIYDLEQFSEYMINYLQSQQRFLREEAHVDLEIGFLPLFADTFPPILSSSLIISCAILLELEMRGYCDTLQRALNLSLSFREVSGSVMERFKRYVSKVAQLPVDWNAARWEDVVGIFEIRNCIVHTGGDLRDFSGASTIRLFAGRHGVPNHSSDRIAVDEQLTTLSLKIASDFINEVYNAALRHFPGEHLPLKQ